MKCESCALQPICLIPQSLGQYELLGIKVEVKDCKYYREITEEEKEQLNKIEEKSGIEEWING